eukprot:g8933.t1
MPALSAAFPRRLSVVKTRLSDDSGNKLIITDVEAFQLVASKPGNCTKPKSAMTAYALEMYCDGEQEGIFEEQENLEEIETQGATRAEAPIKARLLAVMRALLLLTSDECEDSGASTTAPFAATSRLIARFRFLWTLPVASFQDETWKRVQRNLVQEMGLDAAGADGFEQVDAAGADGFERVGQEVEKSFSAGSSKLSSSPTATEFVQAAVGKQGSVNVDFDFFHPSDVDAASAVLPREGATDGAARRKDLREEPESQQESQQVAPRNTDTVKGRTNDKNEAVNVRERVKFHRRAKEAWDGLFPPMKMPPGTLFFNADDVFELEFCFDGNGHKVVKARILNVAQRGRDYQY